MVLVNYFQIVLQNKQTHIYIHEMKEKIKVTMLTTDGCTVYAAGAHSALKYFKIRS